MALRTFNHLLQFSEPVIRRVVPLSIALLCISNPKLSVLDTLSKLSHDPDNETACNSILALGLIGAGMCMVPCPPGPTALGTNHARIAGMLRTLAQYYSKDADALFCVRLAQVTHPCLLLIHSHDCRVSCTSARAASRSLPCTQTAT
jgi:26S proteasome regulatory subunit N1